MGPPAVRVCRTTAGSGTYGKVTLFGALGIPHLAAALLVGGAFAVVIFSWLRSERAAGPAKAAESTGDAPQTSCSVGGGGSPI